MHLHQATANCRSGSMAPGGPIIAELKIKKSSGWNVCEARLSKYLPGMHNLIVISGSDTPVEVDWIRFK